MGLWESFLNWLRSYVVDAADPDNLSISKSELHDLCEDLKSITDREVCCFMISCKNSTNIDSVIDWLVKHSKSKS
ncbi:hypothetical protein JHK87_012466 [Glycine soja]|nr:hypothetical protein JHK87_012466 [Glycine soja]